MIGVLVNIAQLRLYTQTAHSSVALRWSPNATTFVYPSEILPLKSANYWSWYRGCHGQDRWLLWRFYLPFVYALARPACCGRGGRHCQRAGTDRHHFLLPETKGKSLEELSEEPSTLMEKAAAKKFRYRSPTCAASDGNMNGRQPMMRAANRSHPSLILR
jgi:hypothetical protein